ncbi:MAG TPA: choice-of-anchor tandem repeat GloVer-containing protein, partial [Bryobacteraceae bacterium]|nr:choice-of-anchor tandem repeat GloVer-containing protein [Bryobacteraceae bacterium]
MIEHISTTKKRVVASLGVALIGAAITSPVASAQTLTTLVSFDGISAAAPYSALIADTNGNLFGTTAYGGSIFAQAGTVFEIGKTATGYASVPTILGSFDGANGANPYTGLTADTNGNLFGTTYFGGAYGNGTVFEIVKTATGYSTPNVLVSFDGANGGSPFSGVLADTNGDLFGTTIIGGSTFAGT